MKVGDYVRTKDGVIGKIIDDNLAQEEIRYEIDYNNKLYYSQEIVKSSPNIIDLIEVGDYVNGHRVNYINKDREHFNIAFGDEEFYLKSKFDSDSYWLSKEDIKSVVTKEQFEIMEYKVGE